MVSSDQIKYRRNTYVSLLLFHPPLSALPADLLCSIFDKGRVSLLALFIVATFIKAIHSAYTVYRIYENIT